MTEIIWKLLSLILPLALAYGLKKCGVFGSGDYKILSIIAMNITLPAAVINSFSNIAFQKSLLMLPVISLAVDLAVVRIHMLIARLTKADTGGA